MYKRWNLKCFIIWTVLLIIQIIIVYFLMQQNKHNLKLQTKVTFITYDVDKHRKYKIKKNDFNNNNNDGILLPTNNVEEYFEDFNTSICYKSGTDLIRMKRRRKDTNWKCLCLTGWHGTDCGQPEVIWRALLTTNRKQNNNQTGTAARFRINTLRKVERRLIYFTEIISNNTNPFLDVIIEELLTVTDLIVLYNSTGSTSNHNNNYKIEKLKNRNDISVLYINGRNKNEAWLQTKQLLQISSNLNSDDLFLMTDDQFQLPNIRVLQFLKLYNEWPEAVTFRLAWSVYGFYWKHPLKTILTTALCTIQHLNSNGNDLNQLRRIKSVFIVGDLNHVGGWYCQFCMQPLQIIELLKTNDEIRHSLASNNNKFIDIEYIEDLIENGIYLDGKTELVRTHRSTDHYYAPNVVCNNTWKYDWLLNNFYSNIN